MLVAFHPIHEIGAGAGEADHGPADHAFIAAMDRVAEESFFGVLQQQIEENLRRNAIELRFAGFELLEQIVSGSAVLLSKCFTV